MARTLTRSLLFCMVAGAPLLAADPVLWYQHPAQRWGDALPVGTIWNGRKRDRVNPEALKALPEVRRLLFEGKVRAVEALEDEKMMGIPNRQPPYQPLGDLNIEFTGHDNATGYRRELNLATGIARVTYRVGNATFTREMFSSAPDQALVVRISCDKPGQVSFRATLARSQDARSPSPRPTASS